VPPNSPPGPPPEPELLKVIREEIEAAGPVSFARFMDLALYHPTHGYYSHGAGRIGREGDFFTASDVGDAFGRCMARQIIDIDARVGPMDPFDVVEVGSGRGLLARDVLDAIAELEPGLAGRLRYTMVDRSESMRNHSARCVPEARVLAPEELDGGHHGCLLAVELFDALPVHRVRRRGESLVEVLVGVDASGALVEQEAPATGELLATAQRYGAAPEDEMETEIALGAARRLEELAQTLEKGVMIVVDYGMPAAELYDRERRRGTLLAYHGHETSEDYLARVGEQDLTSHVNFTALEDRARECGLDVLGLTTQDRFLVANGVLEEFSQPDLRAARDPKRVKRRLQAMQLIHPEGMGRTFRVLMLSKGCEAPVALSGLDDPFSPDQPS
jgi:SAM-dependent MidA family methyltransferase